MASGKIPLKRDKPSKRKPRRTAWRATKRHFATLLRVEREAGGERALAKQLGVSPSTVRRWKSGSLSAAAWALVTQASGVQRLHRQAEKGELAEFRELIAAAQGADVPERKRLKLGRTGSAPRGGPLTRGVRYTRGWNRMLSERLVGLFGAWASGVPKRFPLWQAVAGVSQLSEGGEHQRGYRTVHFQVRDKQGKHMERAGDLSLDAQIATRRSTVKQEAIDALSGKLLEAARDPKVKTFVKYTTVFNYRMRTPEERRQREGFLRRKRKKAWLKRKAKAAGSSVARQPEKKRKAKTVKARRRSTRRTSSSRSATKRTRKGSRSSGSRTTGSRKR